MRIVRVVSNMLLILLLGTGAEALDLGTPEEGRRLFEQRCATCHGLEGEGDGPLAPLLSPRPASLISAATSVKTDQELMDIIANGKQRTAMPAWKGILSEEQRRDLVAYIRSLVRFHPEPLTPGPLAPDDRQPSSSPSGS